MLKIRRCRPSNPICLLIYRYCWHFNAFDTLRLQLSIESNRWNGAMSFSHHICNLKTGNCYAKAHLNNKKLQFIKIRNKTENFFNTLDAFFVLCWPKTNRSRIDFNRLSSPNFYHLESKKKKRAELLLHIIKNVCDKSVFLVWFNAVVRFSIHSQPANKLKCVFHLIWFLCGSFQSFSHFFHGAQQLSQRL